jgi:hypothetical protein
MSDQQRVALFAAFGGGKTPGNQELGRRLEELVRDDQCVAVVSQQCILQQQGEANKKVVHVPDKRTPPTTLHLTDTVAYWVCRTGVQEVLVYCAPPHRQRVLKDLAESLAVRGLTDIVISIENKFDDSVEWFDADNRQLWVRSPTYWKWYERFLALSRKLGIYRWLCNLRYRGLEALL